MRLARPLRRMSALEIGTAPPQLSFRDEKGLVHSIAAFLGGPLIVAFALTQHRGAQPAIQYLTFEGERLPLLTPDDPDWLDDLALTIDRQSLSSRATA